MKYDHGRHESQLFSLRDAYMDVGARAKHGALAGKATTAGMQEVGQRMEQLPRKRGYKRRQLSDLSPLPNPLPGGEGTDEVATRWRVGRNRQQGVALVTALLVVSLAAVAAVAMAARFQVDMRRTGNLLNGEQAYAYAVAAESWAYVILRRDLKESKHDSLDEDWSTALPPIPIEGGFVNGNVEDLQGRFNVNNLITADGKLDKVQLEYYKRLLDVLGLDAALAPALQDWIDPDIDVTFPDGAEDDEYLRADLPYRAANRPLVDISELRLVKGYTREVLAVLEPHVTALPAATLINVNTATPVVLRALHADLEEDDVEQLLEARDEALDGEPFTDKKAFLAHNALAGLNLAIDVDVKSDWFNVQTDVSVGRGLARLDSRLLRSEKTLQVISRTRTGRRILIEEE
jgi:general secretion pathway protein K